MLEYQIVQVEAGSSEDACDLLEKGVREEIAKDWKPSGGVSITVFQEKWEDRKGEHAIERYTYVQAMIR